jgi:hypothetical protein
MGIDPSSRVDDGGRSRVRRMRHDERSDGGTDPNRG